MRHSLLPLSTLPLLLLACTAPDAATDGDETSGAVVEADAELAPQCKTDEIVAVTRPRNSKSPSGETFTYRVRFKKPRAGLPTVVHLPGGPGLPSIAADTPSWLPEGYGLVETDPRGVGCNPVKLQGDEATFFRTEEITKDVVAAIGELKLDAYLLHGHSYGTVLATHVADALAKSRLPKPAAVVLEGVLGRAFTEEWMGQSYVDQWNIHKKTLPPAVLETLRADEPLGIEPKVWGNFFMMVTSQFGAQATDNALMLLAPDAAGKTDPAKVEQLRQAVTTLGGITPTEGAGHTLQRFVACRELSRDIPDDNVDVILKDGEIAKSPDAGSLCTGLSMEEPFHVKDHLYPFRTYYVLGGNDPATPLWQGKLHFDTLKTADRVEIVVQGSGHVILSGPLKACGPTLMAAAYRGAGFGEALGTCNAAIETRFARAGE
jgi:pimeloyl-ACP methyl ester carboxylesterase